MTPAPERRRWAPLWPFADRRLVNRAILVIIGPIAVWFLTTAMRNVWEAKLDTERFVRDSTARAQESVVLHRIDARISAMYCAGKPPGCQ